MNEQTFPAVDGISESQGELKVRTLSSGGEVLGYVFQSLDVVDIPAYYGKPIDMQVILETAGVVQAAYVLEHHEAILLIGIAEAKLPAPQGLCWLARRLRRACGAQSSAPTRAR